jgi:hypothetical protein
LVLLLLLRSLDEGVQELPDDLPGVGPALSLPAVGLLLYLFALADGLLAKFLKVTLEVLLSLRGRPLSISRLAGSAWWPRSMSL